MRSSFRYVDETADNAVNLFLFYNHSGEPRSMVRPPLGASTVNIDVAGDNDAPLPLSKAFALAIRMANRNDVEIVVSGEATLWDDDWGDLIAPATAARFSIKDDTSGQMHGHTAKFG